ncbi:LacI family DNA-binding transcriptional regulator [Nakamurella deserti]|uniref:LacI family DNA-binding transcriptional regulator n=1 Tax=Nakamurella deserti TaxID=2164074 RepID=UPI00197C6EF4|nr:LacI family DNA-binding transcriptional regulator [Nakamurella deserti]
MNTDQPLVRPRAPGMYDVARAAGVSHQTVSRVLNAHPRVREETRARVLAAIEELGYRRNTAARALVTRRSGTLGVVTARSALYGPTSVMLALEAAAREAGYYVSLVSLADTSAEQIQAALEHFQDQSVEGVVIIASTPDLADDRLTAGLPMPVVTISPLAAPHDGVYVTAVDHLLGGRMATRHLVDLGHRRLAFIGGPADSLDSTARQRGWELESAAAGLPEGRLLRGDWSAQSGYDAGRQLVRRALPDAVFAGNDEMALGLLLALHEAGFSAPHDISVVGFDDIPGAAFFSPPLTTVRQDFSSLGVGCIDLLSSALQGRPALEPVLVPPELVVRGSTAARAAR